MHSREYTPLVLRMMTGDREAFTELYRLTRPLVWGAVQKKTRDTEHSDDLVQEAFFRAWQNRSQVKNPATFIGWVRRIALNIHVDEGRTRKVIVDPRALIPITLADRHVSPDLEVEACEEQEVTAAILHRAMGRLSWEYAEIMTGLYVHEQPYEVVAKKLNVPVGTIRSRAHRAKELLRLHLGAAIKG